MRVEGKKLSLLKGTLIGSTQFWGTDSETRYDLALLFYDASTSAYKDQLSTLSSLCGKEMADKSVWYINIYQAYMTYEYPINI